MTFDEAFNVIREEKFGTSIKDETPRHYGDPEKFDFFIQDDGIGTGIEKLVDLITQLKQEYAPTIEMTKEQKELVLFYKENTWFSVFIGKLNDPDNPVYNSLPILLAFKYWGFGKERESQLMQAWLHPEIIKIVDE